MKTVKGSEFLGKSKEYNIGGHRSLNTQLQFLTMNLKGKILVDEAELRRDLRMWERYEKGEQAVKVKYSLKGKISMIKEVLSGDD